MRDTKPNSAPAPAEPQSPASRRIFLLFVCVAVVAIFAAYANHFHNSFHFDDAHTVVNNVYIRNLHNIPRFFTDATTFSSLPANQTWRPIISLSLAIDYKLGGLNPLWFHISTFFWFLVQLWLMYLLYRYLMDAAAPRPANRYIALFAVLWYGLHPAIAETVNYIIQRADLYATLGVVAGMVIYIRFPALRKFGIYLLPVILGAMSKATAVVFGGILLVYIFLFEEDGQWNRWWPAILRSLPALAVSGILAVMNIKLTSKTYLPSNMPSAMYWATQPYVLMKYVRSLFLPLWLSADTDMNPFTGFTDPLAIVGILFCLALTRRGLLVHQTARTPPHRLRHLLVFRRLRAHFALRAFRSGKRSPHVFPLRRLDAQRHLGRGSRHLQMARTIARKTRRDPSHRAGRHRC